MHGRGPRSSSASGAGRGVFERIVKAHSEAFDLACVAIDGTIVTAPHRAPKRWSDPRGASPRARCRAAVSTSSSGPVRPMTPEDAIGWGTEAVLAGLDGEARLADPESRGITVARPARRNRSVIRDHDRDRDAWRHPIETVLATIKAFRGMAMRFDRMVVSFAAVIDLAAGVIAARYVSTGPKIGRKRPDSYIDIHMEIRKDNTILV